MERLDYSDGNELAIKVIFGEDFDLPVRLLQAKTKVTTDIPELADAIEFVKTYNNFRGEIVADSLRKLHDQGLVKYASFGRGGSPVLYVHPPRREMLEEITEELRKTKPDELWTTSTGSNPCEYSEAFFVRAWWD